MVLKLVPTLAPGNNKLPSKAKRRPLFLFFSAQSASPASSYELFQTPTMHISGSVRQECIITIIIIIYYYFNYYYILIIIVIVVVIIE